MNLRKRTLAAAGAALGLVTVGGVAYAATTGTTATCTSSPVITVGATDQSFDVHCSVPNLTTTATVTKTVTVTASPTTSPTTSTTTPAPTTTTTTAAPVAPAAFPNASNTGVPAGTTLTAYTGGCSLTSGTLTIDSKNIGAACANFYVSGSASITVTKSSLRTAQVTGTSARLTVTDSTINGGATQTQQAAIGVWNGPSTGYGFTGLRLNVSGGKDGLECDLACSLTSSWLHDWATPPNGQHMQAVLNSGGGTNSRVYIKGNRLECKVYVAGDTGGCTADLSLFGDGATVSGVTVDGNYFVNGNTYQSYCAALGYNPGKNHPNPDHVVFTNNVFEVGASGKCGDATNATFWRRAADGATGNLWSNNKTASGTLIAEPASG